MRKIKISHLLIFFFPTLIFIRCTTKTGAETEIDLNDASTQEVSCKVIFTSLPGDLQNESAKLSDNGIELFSGLAGTSKKCNYGFILKPNLIRADLNVDSSIATKLEKSGIAAATPIRDFKVVKKHLEEEVILTEEILQKPNYKSDSLFNVYLSNNILSDSIIIFSSTKDSLEVNGRKYKPFQDIPSIRIQILSILCQNPKATLALLIDPPSLPVSPKLIITSIEQDCQKGQLIVKTSGGDGSPVLYSAQGLSAGTNSNVFLLSKDQSNGKAFTFIAKQGNSTPSKFYTTNCPTTPGSPIPPNGGKTRRSNGLPPVGNLTIIKGTEGCEVCTRYYSAVDATGRMHEIRERNSTNCCPCNKTIEMRGRTYVMNCDGNPRLELVD